MLRAETARLAGQVDAAQTRLGDLQESLSSLRRRSPQRPALQARVQDQTGALGRLQQRLAEAQAVTAAELGTSPAQTWTAEHAPARAGPSRPVANCPGGPALPIALR